MNELACQVIMRLFDNDSESNCFLNERAESKPEFLRPPSFIVVVVVPHFEVRFVVGDANLFDAGQIVRFVNKLVRLFLLLLISWSIS